MKNTTVKLVSLGFALLIVGTFFGVQPVLADEDDVSCNFFERLVEGDNVVDNPVGCNEEIVSFVGFEGGLRAPNADELDPSLTRARNLREFIVNTLNLVLTFLGILALVIVIYGGFLYVSAAGNEETATKGKKAVLYAVIGIVIILGSYALVNTLLSDIGNPVDQASSGGSSNRGSAGSDGAAGTTGATGATGATGPTGPAGPAGQDGRDGLDGRDLGGATSDSFATVSPQSGSNRGQQTIYNLGALEINSSLGELANAYRNLANINGSLKKLGNLTAPSGRIEVRQYILQVTDLINSIKNKAGELSKTRKQARKFSNEYLSTFQGFPDEVMNKYAPPEDNPDAAPERDIAKEVEEKLVSYKILDSSKEDFITAIDSLIGPEGETVETQPTFDATVKGKLPLVWKIMGSVANETNAAQAIERGLISEKDLKRAFAGIDPNITVGQIFKDTIKAIDAARALKDDPEEIELLANAIRSLDRLFIIVKDIKFVYVRVRASTGTGSAPLIVELNGLDSSDPASRTVADERYIWDPDGDGTPGVAAAGSTGSAAVECGDDKSTGSPNIVCTYNKPGTYLVKLRIESADKSHIAAGEAFLPIKVLPPVARINFKASVGGTEPDYIRKYEKDSDGDWVMRRDEREFQVTRKEAQNPGVTFDAAESRGEGDSQLKNFRWSYGDGTQSESGSTKNKIENKKYGREGHYPLTLEVTDRGNRVERKIVTIAVASIAARARASKNIAEPEELLEFDGSYSRSDNGAISSYHWELKNAAGEDVSQLQNDVELISTLDVPVLRAKFKKPGNYSARLTVADASASATKEVSIAIKSRKPRANFVVQNCAGEANCAEPSLVTFDASMSFDPDRGETENLTYAWKFLNELGAELAASDFENVEGGAFEGKDAKKLSLKFKRIGKYKAVLRVNDSHPDPNIQQEDTKEKEFEVTSIVEAKFDPDMKAAAQLKDGAVTMTIKGSVENATLLEIDFGDGESSEKTLEKDATEFEFEHEYRAAGSYLVKLLAESEEDHGRITIMKRIHIAGGDSPLAVMQVMVDGREAVLPEPTDDDPEPALEVIRNKAIKFDARESLNASGTIGGMKYSWSFGDRKLSTGPEAQHSYEDVSPEDEVFTVKLSVSEIQRPAKKSETTFPIRIISKPPQVNTLSLEKKSAGQTTPLDVELTAEGALDPDGRITNYQFWYFHPDDAERKLSVVDAQTNRATLTVETMGEEGKELEYSFCVSVTDNENTISECKAMFADTELPKLKVKNGPNAAPVAAFSASTTNARVGENITFTSSSTDSDGTVKQYYWDFEGDGFQNDNPTELSTIEYKFDRKSPRSGYRVKLKVVDDKGAAGFSTEIPVTVSTKSTPPTAAFNYSVADALVRQVKFFDTSTWDRDAGAQLEKWTWDFDTQKEYGCDVPPDSKPEYCNGNPGDDVDSSDQNPIFDFPESGSHQVMLTVEDSDGNVSGPAKVKIDLTPGASGESGGDTPLSNVVTAVLKTDPPFTWKTVNGKQKKVITFTGQDEGNVTLFWGDSRTSSAQGIINYQIDKDVYCDWDKRVAPEGQPPLPNPRADDVQNPNPDGGSCTDPSTTLDASHCWTTHYSRFNKTANPNSNETAKRVYTTRLKVIDGNNNEAVDLVDVEFSGPTNPDRIIRDKCEVGENPLGGSLFKQLGPTNTILLSLIAGVIVVLAGYEVMALTRRGKKRI